ncbi:putative disease resistance protein, partial [Quercus suber]
SDERLEFLSDEDAINQLEHLFNQIGPTPILLILDDVWPGSESLIEKFKFDIPDYKIMVTSRTAFPRFNSKYNLEPLDHEDAMSLFRHHSAYLQDESSYIPDEYIEKVLFYCVKLCYSTMLDTCSPNREGLYSTDQVVSRQIETWDY